MTNQELVLLQAHFSQEREYLEDGYYRLRQISENQYELAFLVPDACGTTSPHPQITIERQNDSLQAVALMDLVVTPIRRISLSEGTKAVLEEGLTDLVLKFKQVKNLT